MIVLDFYNQVKEQLYKTLYPKGIKDIRVLLYSDTVFSPSKTNKFPLFLFKYNDITWQTSSEREYKATVSFSVYIVLAPDKKQDYTKALLLANKVDQAILLYPTSKDIHDNRQAILKGDTNQELIANSVQKLKEKQCTVEEYSWEKNDYFIWEIQYATTLVEKTYKKKYTLLTNGAFKTEDLKDADKKEEIRNQLATMGIDLKTYLSLSKDQKAKLIDQELTYDVKVSKKEK